MKKSATAKPNFESSLTALERIVRDMEQGDLPLEKSLELFEQGVRLSRECQERLSEAERRVEVLLRDAEGRPFAEALDARSGVATNNVLEDDDDIDVDADEDEDDESVF